MTTEKQFVNPRAFKTTNELENYILENPNATCERIEPQELFNFIRKNTKSKMYIFFKGGSLSGVDVNIKDEYGNTALHNACFNGSIELAEFLIENEADMNIKNEYGWTALHNACHFEEFELAKILIKNRVDTNILGHFDYTALHYACSEVEIKIVKFLVEKGGDMNIRDKYGSTVLHFACDFGNIELAKFLIENRADTDIQDNNGRTALELAKRRQSKEFVEALENAIKKQKTI